MARPAMNLGEKKTTPFQFAQQNALSKDVPECEPNSEV